MKSKNNKGFTLIELMIVVAVLAVIVAIAYPGFLGQIQKARRSDAKQALLDVAAKLEQFYQDNKGYPSTSGGDDITVLGYGSNPFRSIEDYYNVSFISSSTTAYTIQAVPVAGTSQADDADCASFRLNHLGVKSVTGSMTADRCW
jgi:type IV pilus assembly protein PilE